MYRSATILGLILVFSSEVISGQEKKNTQDLPKPIPLFKIDFDNWEANKGELFISQIGQMIQISVTRSILNKADGLRTLKVELEGDQLGLVGIAQIPIEEKGAALLKKHVACFLISKKPGIATIKITPVAADGTLLNSRDWKVRVIVPSENKEPSDKGVKKKPKSSE
jgi:hypothetical protein